MKTTKWLGLFAAATLSLQSMWGQAPPPPAGEVAEAPAPGKPDNTPAVPVNISPATAEVVRLAESGLGDEVVLSYVTNSQAAFNLSADDIVYLKDVGISEPVISQMMSHDRVLRDQGPPPAGAQPPVPTPAPQTSEVVTPPNTPPPEYVSSAPPEVNYFYSDLAPYGTWLDLEGVGWCWQPRCVVVNRGWRPYCDYGHWVYTDCGWYWSSTYSWGWAPFHYGRWEMHPRCGWVWLPDRVWGPAWVTWRVADVGCGWAPLPPFCVLDVHGGGWLYRGRHVGFDFNFGFGVDHFTFVAFHDFGEREVWRHRMPRTEVTRIYNHTTIINNYTINRNTVVNHGVAFDRVSAESHARIQRASIRDVPAGSTSARTGSRRDSVVYRHELASTPKPAARVVAERVDPNRGVVRPMPIVPTRVDTRPGPARFAPERVARNSFVVRPEAAPGTPIRAGERVSSRSERPSTSANESRTTSRRDVISSPRPAERGSTATPPNERSVPREVPSARERNVERGPVTPPAVDRSSPARESSPRREVTPPRSVEREREPVTPPSRPSGPSRERESTPTPRGVERGPVTPPSVPSRSIEREYQQVPRSSRTIEDRPSRPSGRDYESVPRGTYSPKGSEQAIPHYESRPSESRSVPRYEPRSEPRSAAPSYSAPSRGGDSGGNRGGRDRDR